MKYFKVVTIIANAAVFCLVAVRFYQEYMRDWVLFITGLYVAFNVIFSFTAPVEGASWLGMYVKRKKLEEQKRIEALATNSQQGGNTPSEPN